LNLFGLFSYSHPSGKSTCHFQGNYALAGDAIREVVWTLFTYGGCNMGGSSVETFVFQAYVLSYNCYWSIFPNLNKLKFGS
jgi:hypothetical protein